MYQVTTSSPSLPTVSSYSEDLESSDRWSFPPEITRFMTLNRVYPNCPHDLTPILTRHIEQDVSGCSQLLNYMVYTMPASEVSHGLFFMLLDAMPEGAIRPWAEQNFLEEDSSFNEKAAILKKYLSTRGARLKIRNQMLTDVSIFAEMARFQPNKNDRAAAITQRWSQPSIDLMIATEFVAMMVESRSAYTLQTPIFKSFLKAMPEDAIEAYLQFCEQEGKQLSAISESSVEILKDHLRKRRATSAAVQSVSGTVTPESGYTSGNEVR